MRILHSLINPTSWSIVGGSWLDSTGLTDRSPASAALLAWPSGTQTTSTTVAISAVFDAQAIGGMALLGTDLPVGTKLEVTGKRQGDAGFTYPLGGNALTEKVSQFPDQSRGAIWLFDSGIDDLVGVQITIYNDISGSVGIAASQQVAIGEIAAGTAVAIDHEKGAVIDGKDPSEHRRTLAAQSDRVQRTGYRIIKAKPVYGDRADAFSGGLVGAPDWQTLAATLRADPYVVLMLYVDTTAHMQQTSIFGAVTQIPSLESLSGPHYGPSEIVVEEIPA